MKQKILIALGLMVLGLSAFAAIPAMAVVGDGIPYPQLSWDQTMSSSLRFLVLRNMNSDAVLDKETGLVWERSPSAQTNSWNAANSICSHLQTGGRMGWRLPRVEELTSLIDPTQSTNGLPAGHPFSNVSYSPPNYWTATQNVSNTTEALTVSVGNPLGVQIIFDLKQTGNCHIWCVRGGSPVDSW